MPTYLDGHDLGHVCTSGRGDGRVAQTRGRVQHLERQVEEKCRGERRARGEGEEAVDATR